MKILLVIAVIMSVVFVVLLVLIWLRKLQFDIVHRNFLEFEDQFGGRVIRGGFAVRPRFSGVYEGRKLTISITFEGGGKHRKYYLAITLQANSPINFTIMSTDWLKRREDSSQGRQGVKIAQGKYLLEVTESQDVNELDLAELERVVEQLHPFAYILISRTGIILERLSPDIVQDTKFEVLNKMVAALNELRRIVEK